VRCATSRPHAPMRSQDVYVERLLAMYESLVAEHRAVQ
jgi:hypothetical protein